MLRPTAGAIVGSLIAAIVFVVILDFLVFISFVGQGIWKDPRFLTHTAYTLPLYIWLVIVALALVMMLRIITHRIILTESGIKVRGLFRVPKTVPWEQVSGIWHVRDVYRGKAPRDPVDSDLEAAEAFLVMGSNLRRIANVSRRLFGQQAQATLVDAALAHNVRVERIDHARPIELHHMLPGSQSFVDLHPNLLVLAVVLIYVAHNVYTFLEWGL